MYDTRAETSQMNNFPDHLKDYAALVEHINTLLEGKPPSEKGDKIHSNS